jgi:hypothetical protein
VLLYRGESVRMRGPERIHLRVRLRVRVAQAIPPHGLWDAQTAAYKVRLSDQDDREIIGTPTASQMCGRRICTLARLRRSAASRR